MVSQAFRDYAHDVPDIVTELSLWKSATEAKQDEAARALAERLGGAWRFDGLQMAPGGGRVAHFSWQDDDHVLVPGGAARLGYERGSLSLTPKDIARLVGTESFVDAAAVQASFERLQGDLERQTSPRREAHIEPLLVQVEPAVLMETKLPDTSLAFEWAVQTLRNTAESQAIKVEDGIRYRATASREPAFGILARLFRSPPVTTYEVFEMPTVSAVEAQFAADGFRLLTEDEWEWCASAGATVSLLGGDALVARETPLGPDGEPESDESLNALGLAFFRSTYELEHCRGWLKGGDGGAAWCGGDDALRHWAAHAVAFRLKVEDAAAMACRVRRCRSVPSLA